VAGEPRPGLGPGDYFGEIALLTGSDRTATITAKTDMRCYGMTPWDFRPLVESHSAIAWKLLQTMAQRLKEAEQGR
jgi:CRP-like cAMP-binding protein